MEGFARSAWVTSRKDLFMDTILGKLARLSFVRLTFLVRTFVS